MIIVFLERVVIFIVQMYNTINQYFTPPPIYYVKNYKFSLIRKRIQVFYFNSIIYLGKLKTEKVLDFLCITKKNKG